MSRYEREVSECVGNKDALNMRSHTTVGGLCALPLACDALSHASTWSPSQVKLNLAFPNLACNTLAVDPSQLRYVLV